MFTHLTIRKQFSVPLEYLAFIYCCHQGKATPRATTDEGQSMSSVILVFTVLLLWHSCFWMMNYNSFLTNAVGHDLKSVRSKKGLWVSIYMTHQQGKTKSLGRVSRIDLIHITIVQPLYNGFSLFSCGESSAARVSSAWCINQCLHLVSAVTTEFSKHQPLRNHRSQG